MNRVGGILLAAAMALSSTVAGEAQNGKTFKARLSTVPMDLAMASSIAGSGAATATLAGNRLTVNGTFEGLKSPATIAQIHKAQPGTRGPAVFDLKVTSGTSGTITGEIDLTPQQAENLRKGWLYLQLHSEKAPDGNLWGWFLPQESRR